MLMGTYTHTLDPKGRLIIPAKLREDLGYGFVMTRNLDHCIALYPMKEWDRFKEKLDALPKISSEPARRLRRFFLGNSVTCEVDKQYRILIDSELRKYAGLSKDVTLIGVDDHVEIWDTETWKNYNDEMDVTALMEDIADLNL